MLGLVTKSTYDKGSERATHLERRIETLIADVAAKTEAVKDLTAQLNVVKDDLIRQTALATALQLRKVELAQEVKEERLFSLGLSEELRAQRKLFQRQLDAERATSAHLREQIKNLEAGVNGDTIPPRSFEDIMSTPASSKREMAARANDARNARSEAEKQIELDAQRERDALLNDKEKREMQFDGMLGTFDMRIAEETPAQ